MSLRLFLICLALFVAVSALPAPSQDAPPAVPEAGAEAAGSVAPGAKLSDSPQARTFALLLPLLFPEIYSF